MDDILNDMKNKNLISKRVGICDHMPANKYTRIVFNKATEYWDLVRNPTPDEDIEKCYGRCIKNQYVNDEWLCDWIKSSTNKRIGKNNAFYVYNVDYDGIIKPMDKYMHDEKLLYQYANGVMYYDFDNLNPDIVDDIQQCFLNTCNKHKNFQWFERSWSGNGCHIRLKFDLKLHHKVEWMYLYMHYLNIIINEISKVIDVSNWNETVIDWSCATIERGFAIPYNENGVIMNEQHDSSVNYNDIEEFNMMANWFIPTWNDYIRERFFKKIDKPMTKKRALKSKYTVTSVSDDGLNTYQGEKFDYNWRLKCVTTLMCIYDGDKDKVREACKHIYQHITPYKNHTFDEMIGNELEEKIFRNGNMELGVSHEIIDDLRNYFGFEFGIHKCSNDVYFSDFHKNIFNI